MNYAYSNKKVLDCHFEVADFTGEWLASIGRPELRGSWIIWGGSGSGKTTFTLMLTKYLSRFGRVAYNSLEQGLSASLQMAWKRVAMEEAGSQVVLLDREQLDSLRTRLQKRHAPQIVVIDSLQYMVSLRMREYVNLLAQNPNKLFIWIAHEEDGRPMGKLANQIRYDANVKIRVEGYKAFVTTRYENPEKGEGGADFVIWDKGAQEYFANNL